MIHIKPKTMQSIPRRSIFLDHTSLEIFELRNNKHCIAHQLIISGISYISQFYPAVRRPYDVIEEVFLPGLNFRKTHNHEDYPNLKRTPQSFIHNELLYRIVGERLSKIVRVRLPSISSIPYYAIFDISNHMVRIERSCIVFRMTVSRSIRDGHVMDPLLYEFMYVRECDPSIYKSYLIDFTALQLDIPKHQLMQCGNVKSAEALHNMVNACVSTSAANKKKLCEIFAPKTARELYNEACNHVLDIVGDHLIPPLAVIVWQYTM